MSGLHEKQQGASGWVELSELGGGAYGDKVGEVMGMQTDFEE